MSVAAKLTANPSTAKDNRLGSFIVEFWSCVFQLPQYISPFWWIRQLFPRASDSYQFVDAWVLGRFFGAILLYLATATPPLQWLESIAVAYGGLMVVEALFYEADLLVFHGYRSAKKGELHSVLSHRRLVITSLQNYCAIIFWFALFYRHWDAWFAVKGSHGVDRVVTWLALSFKTMTGLGHISVEATTLWADILLLAQAAIGVSMALLIVVSFVRLLPKPGTKAYWESPRYWPHTRRVIQPSTRERSGIVSEKKEPPYAIAAIIGSLTVGAINLGFAYQLFSHGGMAALHGHPPLGAWTCANAWPAVLFFVLGVALVGSGIGLAVYALRSHRASTTQEKSR